ncbi:DUF3494 domain-containing protein [Opitutaceae bacterium TAV4]|nr:DUF3494 domain-containing protein [Opitutaceae bacterium TAV4]RRK00853.1 DUF3494 domain-containing protein [Opitutaceae bacterium TAV3]
MLKIIRPILLPVAAFAAAFGVPATVSAQSILLSAGDFTLLGGTTITSSGASGTVISNGNVGVGPGTAVSGFPPALIVNGGIIETGSVTNQAHLDLIKAATGLALMAFDTNLGNVNLGGQTLLPGIYKFDSAAALTGALVLDANGQDDAFWVFQIGTSLTTSVGASVTVINTGSNGGSDLGIFWNTGTEITFGADNVIAGNYISGTSITAGDGTAGGARLLALAAVTLGNNQIDALGGLGGGDWTGGLTYAADGITMVPVPEPAAVLWLAPLGALGFTLWRRRQGHGKAVA